MTGPPVVPVERRRDFERGMDLLADLDEVMPEDAVGQVAELYEDFRSTLRVPFVNFLFRALADDPGSLGQAWAVIRPQVSSMGLERGADYLRASAAPEPRSDPPDADWDAFPALDHVRTFTASIHYVLPKLLLVATAFDRLFSPETEAREARAPITWYGLGADELLPPGVARGTVSIPLVDPEESRGRLRELFEEIVHRHGHPGVASYYRALGQWPPILDALWSSIRNRIVSPARLARKRHLIALASAIERGLFGADDPTPEGLRNDESSREDIAALLAVFRFRLIPDLLLDVSSIRGMTDGPGAAHRSPFSAADSFGLR